MRLLTWNVQWFCGIDDRVSVERVVDAARAFADFDVLCLQEVAVDWPRLTGCPDFDQVARLESLLPGYTVCFGAAVDQLGRHGRRQRFGNLIATRLPLLAVQHHPLPWPDDHGVRTMPRMASVATVGTEAGPLRVMTAHLEFFSARQRMAQARALVDLHAQACAQAARPPLADDSGSPFQDKPHTRSAVLCGDFNLSPADPEYPVLQSDAGPDAAPFVDAWTIAHGATPHVPTFRVYDKRYGPDPVACDFVFVSADLRARVRRVAVQSETTVSDHQPVLIELD